jgi:phage antirepressor YoqD-like protein
MKTGLQIDILIYFLLENKYIYHYHISQRNKIKFYDTKNELLKYSERIRFTIHKLTCELINNAS